MPTASELITKIRAEGVDAYARDMGKAESVTDKTAKNMNAAGKSASGLGSAFGGVAKQAAGVATGLGVFHLAQSAVGGLGGAIVGFNARMEQATIGFTTMLGSGEKARSFLGELQTFAAKTPFEFPELVTASQRMLAMGTSADQVIPRLTAIGDAVAGLGGGSETINRVVTALGQMQAKGKVSAEEMMQLTEAGIPAWEMLANAIGVSIPEAMKMAERGAISADTAINAITEGMNQRFGGMMAAQSKTFSGAMSTIKDSVNVAIGTAFQPLFQILADGSVKLAEFMSGERFAAWSASATTALGSVISSATEFAGVLVDLGTAAADLAGHVGGLQPILIALGAGLATLMIASTVAGAIASLAGVWATFSAGLAAGIPAITLIVAALGGPLTLAIIGISAAVAALVLAWQNDWGGIQGKTQAVVNAIQPILEALGGRLREFGEVILPELTAAWQNMSDQVGSIASGIQSAVEPVFSAIAGFIRAHGAEITAILQGAWDIITTLINTATGVISNTIQFWLNVLQGDWSGAWQNIKNIVDIAWSGIKQAAEIFLSTVLPNVISVGKAAVTAVWNAFWEELKASASNMLDQLIELLKALPGRILDALSGIGTLLVGVGRDLIQGFINGVNDMWNDAINFVGDLFDAVIGGVKSVLGINSPSTVMASMGRDFIQGFIDGTGSMAGALKDFVTGLVGNAVSAARDAAGGVIGAIGGAVSGAAGAVGIGGGGGGGDVGGWVRQAMAITGVPDDWYASLMELVRLESGGNPNAVNPTAVIQGGVNYGHATGLFQTLPGTFSANNLTGGSITDPVANAVAAINYIRGRYGHPANAVRGHAQRGGYAAGGTVEPGWFTVGERGPELGFLGSRGLHIFSNEQSKALLSGMSGGASIPGFAGGSGARFSRPDQFAAAIASPGGWTPDLASAFFEGMKFIADGAAAAAEELEALGERIGDTRAYFPKGTRSLSELLLEAANRGLQGPVNELLKEYQEGRKTLEEVLKMIMAFLSGATGGQAPGGFDYGSMRQAVAEGVAMAMGGRSVGGMANAELTNTTRRTV